MAGGSGTRFWPKSTKALPKQFLNLFGDGTMIQNTVKRIEGMIPRERILVVTNESYTGLVQKQLPGIPEENILGEPVARNTAPCVAIAAELLYQKDPDAIMVVLPADHHIQDAEAFSAVLDAAVQKAERGRFLLTLGISPTRPETGFGYIKGDNSREQSMAGHAVYPVKEFTEKPDEKTAQKFIASGNYYWNSGMFIWKADTVLKEFEKQLPGMYALVKKAGNSLYKKGHNTAIREFYEAAESVSIDYGIMEGAENVFVVPGSFGWNDVGSWPAVYDLGDKDANDNVNQAKTTLFSESTGNYVFSQSGKAIALVGVERLAIVETDTALLICNLDKAQGVKDVVNKLSEKKELKKFL